MHYFKFIGHCFHPIWNILVKLVGVLDEAAHLPFFELLSFHERTCTRRIFVYPANKEEDVDLRVPVEVPLQIKFPWSRDFVFCAPFKVENKSTRNL